MTEDNSIQDRGRTHPQLTDEEFEMLNAHFDASGWNAEHDFDDAGIAKNAWGHEQIRGGQAAGGPGAQPER